MTATMTTAREERTRWNKERAKKQAETMGKISVKKPPMKKRITYIESSFICDLADVRNYNETTGRPMTDAEAWVMFWPYLTKKSANRKWERFKVFLQNRGVPFRRMVIIRQHGGKSAYGIEILIDKVQIDILFAHARTNDWLCESKEQPMGVFEEDQSDTETRWQPTGINPKARTLNAYAFAPCLIY